MYRFKTGVSNRVNLNAVLCVLPAVCLLFLAAGTAQAQRTAVPICAALNTGSEDCARITNISTIPHSDLVLAAALGLGDVSIHVDVSWLISTAVPICAALDMSSEDCTRITSISTIPHSDLMLPAALGLGDVSIAVDVPWLISTAATEGGTSLCSGAVGHSQTRCLVPEATLPAATSINFSLRSDSEARLDRPAFAAGNRILEDRFAALGRCHSQGLGVNGIRG